MEGLLVDEAVEVVISGSKCRGMWKNINLQVFKASNWKKMLWEHESITKAFMTFSTTEISLEIFCLS